MAAVTVSTTELSGGATELDRWFGTDDRQQVLAYLERHPHLVPLLVDVAAAIGQFFPPEDRPYLQVIDDPDTQTVQLYAIVRTSLPPDEADERLDRLDEEWWLDAVERAHGDLTIDVESV